jgi:hypothetical protein
MASCLKAQLGVLNAESFVEHINSLGNLVCTNASQHSLLDEEISMLVILQMNESFMMHMHQYYKAGIKRLGLETFGRGIAVDNPDGPLILE